MINKTSNLSNYRPKIGLLGGTFNPPHNGHLKISKQAKLILQLDEIWWIIALQNPLKSSKKSSTFDSRYFNAKKFLDQEKKIIAKPIELEINNQFSYYTINYLINRYNNYKFVWIMGADNLNQIQDWKYWHKIFESIPIAVFNRPKYSYPSLSSIASKFYAKYRLKGHPKLLSIMEPPIWTFIWNSHENQSATEIRKLRQQN